MAHLFPAHNPRQLKKLWPGRQQGWALCAGSRSCPGQRAVSVCLLSKDVQDGRSAWHQLGSTRHRQGLDDHCIRWTAAEGNTHVLMPRGSLPAHMPSKRHTSCSPAAPHAAPGEPRPGHSTAQAPPVRVCWPAAAAPMSAGGRRQVSQALSRQRKSLLQDNELCLQATACLGKWL